MRILVDDDQVVICHKDRRLAPRSAYGDGNTSKSQPRATVQRFISNELISEVKFILQKFQRVNIKDFRLYYRMEFKNFFCTSELGFDDGIEGFFEHLSDFVVMEQTPSSIILSLKSNTQLEKKTVSIHSIDSPMPCDDSLLFFRFKKSWKNSDNRLLFELPQLYNFHWLDKISEKQLHVPSSPYQAARQRWSQSFDAQVAKIRQALRRHPDGLGLTELSVKVGINLELFGVGSIVSLTTEYNEIFYTVDPAATQPNQSTNLDLSEEDDQEATNLPYNVQPLLFDGFEHCYDFKTIDSVGKIPNHWFYITFKALFSGVYQKTVILIKRAGSEGLQMGVWHTGYKQNFKPTNNNAYEKELLDLSPLELFEALAAFGFLRQASNPHIKNDIRIFWEKQNYSQVLYKFIDYLEASKLHFEEPEVGIRTIGLPRAYERPEELTQFYRSVNRVRNCHDKPA